MTIEEAVEILNKYNHFDSSGWEVQRFSPHIEPYIYSTEISTYRSKLEAISIAKEYLSMKIVQSKTTGDDFVSAIERLIYTKNTYNNLPLGGNKIISEAAKNNLGAAREKLSTMFDELIGNN